MVFSTIKFYGVPAGHHVRRDSPDKEVSTRCCEPSHAITTTVSWLSVLFYFACILPQHTKQQDGTTRAACSAALSTSLLFHILHVSFPPLVWRKADCAAAWRTHFVYSVASIELKWWIHCFRLGREYCRVAIYRPTFAPQMWAWSTLYPSQVKMQACSRVLPLFICNCLGFQVLLLLLRI